MFNEIMYRTERIVSSVSCQWESEGRIGERNNNRRMSSVWMLVDLYERPQEMHMAMATNTFLLPHTRSLSSLDNHHLKNRLPKKSHPWTMTSRTWIWTRLQKKAGHRGMIRNDEEPEGGIGDVVWDEYAPSEPADDEGDPVAMKLDAGKALWDDDELAERQQEEDQEEEAKAEHRPPIPMDHLCYVKPLKSKKSKVVMQAIQEIVLELRNENLPVVRIHSDRAHELRSAGLREWALDQGILLTRTEGQSPQSNGTAERAVRFLKGKARLMLRASGLGPSHWATAMITAAHHQREQRLQPEEYVPVCPYGSKVAIKKKRYKDGGKHDLLPHWVKGTYLGPVWDVKHGSAVLDTEAGRITVTTHIRPRLHNPGVSAEAPRLVRKTPVDDDGVAIRRLGTARDPEERARMVKEILKMINKEPRPHPTRPQLAAQPGQQKGSYTTHGAYNQPDSG